VKKQPDTPADSTPAANRGRLTRNVLLFASVVYLLVPFVLACIFADENLYTRMELWGAMNISLQSVDPGRIAIDDPKKDIAILESLVSPELRREGFAQKMHARWRQDRFWAIRDGDLESFEATEDSTTIVMLLKMDVSTDEGTHIRDVRETTTWHRIGRTWYLVGLEDKLVEQRFKPWPGVVRP
jgi:hypothetical protein